MSAGMGVDGPSASRKRDRKQRIVDMSVPPEQRSRKPKGKRKAGKGGGTAQMDHGRGSKADRLRKVGEAKIRGQRRGRR